MVRTFSVLLVKFVQAVYLSTPLGRQLFLAFLTLLDPFYGVIYIVVGIAESCTDKLSVEFAFVPAPVSGYEDDMFAVSGRLLKDLRGEKKGLEVLSRPRGAWTYFSIRVTISLWTETEGKSQKG
jgi:hypothetical protein